MHQQVNRDAKHRALTLPISTTPGTVSSQATSISASPLSLSLQSSPDALRAQDGIQYGYMSPLQLPTSPASALPPPKGPSALGEAFQTKSPTGLIRRFSGRLSSRRSSNNMRSRDHSSGPLVNRRRSGSKTGYESDMATNEGYSTVDEAEGSPWDPMSGLIPSASSSVYSGSRKASRVEDYEPPVIPDSLRCGTRLTKVTRKGRHKQIYLVFDGQAAKVTWKSMSKSLYIDDIQAIRVRGDAKKIRDDLSVPAEFENRWLTIVYADTNRSKGRPIKEMNLIFPPDENLFESWTGTLLRLHKYRHDLIAGLAGPGLDESTLRSRWNQEMDKFFQGQPRATTHEVLDLVGIKSVCHSLNINWSPKTIRDKFNKADPTGSGFLDYHQFRAFVKDVKVRSDVLHLVFNTIPKQHSAGLLLNEFLAFLQEHQGVSVAAHPTYWESVFLRFVQENEQGATRAPNGTDPLMGFSAFNAFLSSAHNSILRLGAIEGKLDQPLNQYFIASSHNTYLLGRQWLGSSSIEGYIRALQQGCRCVEIDCWDGKAEHGFQPTVTHGRTRTTRIPFADCISVISRYAFEASLYPLILSLEVHCDATQQEIMVDIMRKELGDRLVTKLVDPNSTGLPSPEDLRGKILIKAKTRALETIEESGSPLEKPVHTRQRSVSSPAAQQAAVMPLSGRPGGLLSSPASMSPLVSSVPPTPAADGTPRASSSADDSEMDAGSLLNVRQSTKNSKCKIVERLDKLCVYTRGLKFRNFTSDGNAVYNHIFSLSQNTFTKLCRDKEQSMLLEKHNMDCLMRVYPSISIDSPNFDPLQCWRRGVQMVALNYQTYDTGMQINEAMFASGSDRSGYVLKPPSLRTGPGVLDRSPESLKSMSLKRVRFAIDVISAQFLPRPVGPNGNNVPSPYIEIQVYIPDEKGYGTIISEGGQEAQREKSTPYLSTRRRTKIVPNNGYDPRFETQFRFAVTTKHPDLAFVQWSVYNSSDASSYNNNTEAKPEATFTAKLSSLLNGYRHLPLRNRLGEQYSFSTIFCKINKFEETEFTRKEQVRAAKSAEAFASLPSGVWKKAGQVMGIKRNTSFKK